MSYTRPPYDAADATWQGITPAPRPAHDAADATWQSGAAATAARVTVAGPLGAPATVIRPVSAAAAHASGPLGQPTVGIAAPGRANIAVAGPLGTPRITALAVHLAVASTPGPLGIASVAAAPATQHAVRIVLPGPLGVAAVRASTPTQVSAIAAGPLGTAGVQAKTTLGAAVLTPGPLGTTSAVAAFVTRARAGAAGPLGIPAAVAERAAQAWLHLSGPLGQPALLARPEQVSSAWGQLPGPLGTPAIVARRPPQPVPVPPPVVSVARLLTDPLPLRRSVELPRYRADAVLPWAYGRVTLAPIPLDDRGLEWLLADHPIVAVERVTVAGQATTGWQLVQRTDDTGRAIATLRLTQPGKPGDTIAVQLIGRRHPTTGAALEHPADIAADLLRQCGWSVPLDAFHTLRDAFPALALGTLFDRSVTLRAALAAIIEPLGTLWTAHPLSAVVPGTQPPAGTLGVLQLDDIRATARRDTLATIARVTYAHDWSTGAPRQSLMLHAPEAIDRYGRIETDIELPAVRTARDALAIGAARLADLARPSWVIEASLADRDAAAAQLMRTVTLDHPHAPAGNVTVTARAHDRTRATVSLTLTRPAGPAPRIELMRRGAALDAAAPEPVGITYRDGVATFVITDESGNPLAGASVTLDGTETRTTDREGRVQFRTERGPHTLTVYLAGYDPFEMDVIV